MPASRPPRPQNPPSRTTSKKRRSKKPVKQKPLHAKGRKSRQQIRKRSRKQGTRIACLAVPLFPLAARLRCEPELINEGVAIFEGNGHQARVVAATRRARKAGVRIGMTLTQARARMPKLVARARDPESERTAREVMLEISDRFTPRVQDEEAGCVYLDVTGLDRHYRRGDRSSSQSSDPISPLPLPPDPEAELGQEILLQLDAAGIPARIGIAASKLAARVAASLPRSERGHDGPVVVPSGEEAHFLAPLPLHRLSPQSEIADTLKRWGIESIGEFAKLPKAEVASRLGEVGRQLHATARGLDPRPLTARQPALTFREGMRLEWPIINLEPFLFIARAALERLCARLETRGLGCKRLEMSLSLEPEGYHERSIELPSPTREVKTLITLLRLDLEAHAPGAPVAAFSLLAHPDVPKLAQLSLLGPASLSPDRLATTIARLFALLGPGRVGSPRTTDGHRPERFRLVEYTPPPPPKVRPPLEPGRGLLSVRVVRPPIALEVLTDERPKLTAVGGSAVGGSSVSTGFDGGGSKSTVTECTVAEPHVSYNVGLDRQPGLFRRCYERAPRPTEVRSEIHEDGKKRLQIQGAVRIASGPWELEERWWAEDRTKRDYWDIELSDGALYRIYREREKDKWFADGIYD